MKRTLLTLACLSALTLGLSKPAPAAEQVTLNYTKMSWNYSRLDQDSAYLFFLWYYGFIR